MSLSITLSPDAERKLKDRAQAAGVDAAVFASQLLERSLKARSLEEISGSVHERFLASGATDDELADELEQAKHEMR